MKTKRLNMRPWLQSRLRRLRYKLDAGNLPTQERLRCEHRELELKRALWTGWQSNAPSMTRSMAAKLTTVANRFVAQILQSP